MAKKTTKRIKVPKESRFKGNAPPSSGGVMEAPLRTLALDALHWAANNVAADMKTGNPRPKSESESKYFPDLKAAWKAFPEGSHDCNVPPVAEILKALDKCKAIDLFERRNGFTKQNRFLKNQANFLDEDTAKVKKLQAANDE